MTKQEMMKKIAERRAGEHSPSAAYAKEVSALSSEIAARLFERKYGPNSFGKFRVNTNSSDERGKIYQFFLRCFFTSENSVKKDLRGFVSYLKWCISEFDNWPEGNRWNYVGFITSVPRYVAWKKKVSSSTRKISGKAEQWSV